MGYRKAPNPEGKTTVSHYSTLPRHSEASVSQRIDDVQPTSETLTGRAGLSLFVRYVRSLGLDPDLDRLFGSLRKSRKGQPVTEIFKQLWCFFLDGSSRHLVSFDALKEDPGYGAAIETKPEALLSSHAVKRFFGRFSMWRIWLFRRLLQQLFLWRAAIATAAPDSAGDGHHGDGQRRGPPSATAWRRPTNESKGFSRFRSPGAACSSMPSFGEETSTPTTPTRPRRP